MAHCLPTLLMSLGNSNAWARTTVEVRLAAAVPLTCRQTFALNAVREELARAMANLNFIKSIYLKSLKCFELKMRLYMLRSLSISRRKRTEVLSFGFIPAFWPPQDTFNSYFQVHAIPWTHQDSRKSGITFVVAAFCLHQSVSDSLTLWNPDWARHLHSQISTT